MLSLAVTPISNRYIIYQYRVFYTQSLVYSSELDLAF